MERKKLLVISILLLLTFNILAALNLGPIPASAADYPSVYVDPESTIDPGYTSGPYEVAIKTDYTGLDITAYQLTLSFNPTVLNGVSLANGDIIDFGLYFFNPGTFDNVAGTLSLTGAFFFTAGDVAPGPGTLATVTFEVVGTGESNITIGKETQLIGWDASAVPPTDYYIVNAITMPSHLGHGYFSNEEVSLEPPVAVISAPSAALVGEVVTFDGSGSSDSDGTIVSYSWDFGDTNTDTGVTVTHAYAAVGVYTVNLTVTDDDGLTDWVTHSITITTETTTVDTLIMLVEDFYNQGAIDEAEIKESLLDKLYAANKMVNRGKTRTAKNILKAFINQLKAQSGKHVREAEALILIADAEQVINNL